MGVKLVILALMLGLIGAMFTSPDEWLEKGFNIRDGIFEEPSDYNLKIETKCNEVNLSKSGSPYNYNGTGLSGYLKVGKGNSALAFIFYGK